LVLRKEVAEGERFGYEDRDEDCMQEDKARIDRLIVEVRGAELRPGEKAEGYAEEDRCGDREILGEPMIGEMRVGEALDRKNDRGRDEAERKRAGWFAR
jgi:hypothetical protein